VRQEVFDGALGHTLAHIREHEHVASGQRDRAVEGGRLPLGPFQGTNRDAVVRQFGQCGQRRRVGPIENDHDLAGERHRSQQLAHLGGDRRAGLTGRDEDRDEPRGRPHSR